METLFLAQFVSFNRTFKELKYRNISNPGNGGCTFNRTFKELKYINSGINSRG